MSNKGKQLGAILVTVVGSLIVGAPSHAVPGVIVSPPGGTYATYANPITAVSQDGTLTHYQTDLSSHDVVSRAKTSDPATWDPRYCPLQTGGLEVYEVWDGWTEEERRVWIMGDPSTDKPAHPCNLFWSPLIYIGELAEVFISMPDGSPKLEVTQPGGTGYDFYCTIHPFMTGSLIVLPPEG